MYRSRFLLRSVSRRLSVSWNCFVSVAFLIGSFMFWSFFGSSEYVTTRSGRSYLCCISSIRGLWSEYMCDCSWTVSVHVEDAYAKTWSVMDFSPLAIRVYFPFVGDIRLRKKGELFVRSSPLRFVLWSPASSPSLRLRSPIMYVSL